MNVILLGAAGFIGTNLAIRLSETGRDHITLIDKDKSFFKHIEKLKLNNIEIKQSEFEEDTDFKSFLKQQDVVYHLISTTVPTTSNQRIPDELSKNIITTSRMLEACVECGVKKVVFISSGGTVYGKESSCPLKEETPTYPITSYGVQKITIEKLLYLYKYTHKLDYRVIRLANPYGPYQRPNGILGAVTTFTYKALKNEEIVVYGDGTVIRDFIYIEDAVRGIINIVEGESEYTTFNLGSGYGTSIHEVIDTIEEVLGTDLNIIYKEARKVDVPVNYLDISRYEKAYGRLNPSDLKNGILKTAEFIKYYYNIQE